MDTPDATPLRARPSMLLKAIDDGRVFPHDVSASLGVVDYGTAVAIGFEYEIDGIKHRDYVCFELRGSD